MLASARAEADRLFHAGAFVTARAHFSSILTQHLETSPPNHEAIYRLHLSIAACSLLLDDFEGSERAIQEALRYQPQGSRAHAMLAQLAASRGDAPQARSLAQALLVQHPEQRDAWIVLLQTSPDAPHPEDIPEGLRDDPSIQLSVATKLAAQGRVSEALDTARIASQSIADDPQLAVAAAELLLFLTQQIAAPAPSREDNALIQGLISGALAATTTESPSRLAARALAAQSTLRFALGDTDSSLKDSERALRADPTCGAARFAYARALGHSGDPDAGLSVLDGSIERSSDPDTLILRATLLVHAKRSTPEITTALERAFEALNTDTDNVAALASLAGIAAEAGVAGLSTTLLDRIDGLAPNYVVSCFRARLSQAQGDEEDACTSYGEALAAAPAHERTKIAYEYAVAACQCGRFSTAVELIENTDVAEAPDFILTVYVDALAAIGRLDRVAEIVNLVRSRPTQLPAWALDAASYVALHRDDVQSAISYLEELLGRGDTPVALELTLAYAYSRVGLEQESLSLVRELCSRSDLTDPTRIQLSQLLFTCREYGDAIQLAHVALRGSPPSPETDAVYVSIFAMSPDDIAPKALPDVIAANTWVKLVNDAGREVQYQIFDRLTELRFPHELHVDSDAAKQLLGRSVGDSVTLRPRDVEPEQYTVVEIQTVWGNAFREALERAQTRISLEPGPLQSIRIRDSQTGLEFVTLTSMLQQQQDRQTAVDRHYMNGQIPLALLGRGSGKSCRDSYLRAVQLDSGLLVDDGRVRPEEICNEIVLPADAVVIHTSALITLQELGLLDLLSEMFTEIRIASSAVQELRSDLRQTQGMQTRDMAWAGLEESNLVADRIPKEVLDNRERKLRDLVDWTSSRCEQLGCPEEGMSPEGSAMRDLLGPPSYDVHMLSDGEVPLYADDLVLRRLGEGERQAKSFSTYAFLLAGVARNILDEAERLGAVVRLIELRHQFIPVSASSLLEACRKDNYDLGSALRGGFKQLLAGTDDSGAPVFAAFVRGLSVVPLRGGLLGAIVTDFVTSLREAGRVESVRTYRQHVRGALRLHPVALDELERAFDAALGQ